MLCEAPYRQGAAEFGCAKCLPCRINARRLWTSRLVLESLVHETCLFATFTFSEVGLHDNTRATTDPSSVSVREAQLLIKRIRSRLPSGQLRYYIVGEYGDSRGRPHYHAVLFGGPHLRGLGTTGFSDSWDLGSVHLGFGEPASIGYVVGYVTKGWKRVNHPGLRGRAPEFARMSKNPGLGTGALVAIGDWCSTRAGAEFIAKTGDVPRQIRTGGRLFPLGRYLTRKLRQYVGIHEADGSVKDAITKLSAEMYVELSLPGAFLKHESKRRQSGRQARARIQIQSSTRTI